MGKENNHALIRIDIEAAPRAQTSKPDIATTLTQLLNDRLQLIQISLVLSLVLDLLLDTLQDPHGRSVVVDFTGRTQSGSDDFRSGDKIVCKAVVESTLEFEKVRA
jgi:hypothetical protein